MIDLRTVAADDEAIILEAIAAVTQPASQSAASIEM
jgi:hypothetical protein